MQTIIQAEGLSYTYLPKTPYERKALQNITFSVDKGDCLGIIGSNGSGKSTLVQLLNGVLDSTCGKIVIDGEDISRPEIKVNLWRKVGLVFQYPEQQLFGASVFDDVAYGPRNLGLDPQTVEERTIEALLQVGLNPEEVRHLPLITLSGGMRRRVAIAGTLAIQPRILILDEPTAGLDPLGRFKLLSLIVKLRREQEITTVIISHSLRDILHLANKIAVLDRGSLKFFGDINKVIAKQEFMAQFGHMLPDYLKLIRSLAEHGKMINKSIRTLREAEAEIYRLLKENSNE